MRSSMIFLGAVLVAGTVSKADDLIIPRPECTYSRAAAQAVSAPAVWHRISANAELAAPTATTSPRRRAAAPPKGNPWEFTPVNFVDSEIFGKMVKDGVHWTGQSTDAEFLRRVTIDLTGEIPTPDDVKAFLADTSPDKRTKAIDRLLNSDAFVDRWTMWFGDLVQNVQVASNTTETYPGRDAYYRFIRDSIKSRKPYDQMVREAIGGIGKSFTNGEVNYYVRDIQNNGPIQDTYDNESASTGARFLAMPLQCLSCHNGVGHLEQVNSAMSKRTRYDFWKNAAFFAQITVTRARDAVTNQQETTLADNTTGAYRLNTTSGNKTPRTPINGLDYVDPAFFLGGDAPQAGESRRAAYGRILTSNPQFARAAVNYLWKEIFGFGIVEPADSFDLNRLDPASLAPGATLQPTHPQLLTQLANAFVSSQYDLRAILKTMVLSNAYQLSSRYTAGTWSETYTPYYARHYPRRMMSEEILDGVVKATGVGITINLTTAQGQTPIQVTKAMQLPDTTEGGGFRTLLNNFGRGNRDDDPRASDSSIVQALSLLNDNNIVSRVRATNAASTVAKTLAATKDPGAIADALYLATLSRYPDSSERAAAINYLKSGDLNRKTEDLQFALLNKLEFLFN
jgi:Protein of unknown function (DUF1549)/Protein of unknown function (DUF1553)